MARELVKTTQPLSATMNGANGNGVNGNGAIGNVLISDVVSDDDFSDDEVSGTQDNGVNDANGAVQPPLVFPFGRTEAILHRILDHHNVPGEPHTTAERLFLVVHPQVLFVPQPGTTPGDGPFPPETGVLPGDAEDLEAEYDEFLSTDYALKFSQAWREHPAIREAKERLGLRQTLMFLSLALYASEHLNHLTPTMNFQARDWFHRTLLHIEVAWQGANV